VSSIRIPIRKHSRTGALNVRTHYKETSTLLPNKCPYSFGPGLKPPPIWSHEIWSKMYFFDNVAWRFSQILLLVLQQKFAWIGEKTVV
jgi:hypothetical protein